jgi:transposase
LAARRGGSAPFAAAFESRRRAERARLSRHAAIAKAIDYILTRWPSLIRFLEDGRICPSNNAAERALYGLALGRKSWLFAQSERAALTYTLIQTANSVDPQAWLAGALTRIADTPQTKPAELLPRNWRTEASPREAA